jgi:uncharacterized protein
MFEITVRFIVLVTVAIFVASLVSFWRLVHPTPIVGTRIPSDVGMEAKEISLETEDEVKLSAWFIEPEPRPESAIVILHGYPAERSDMLGIARELYPNFTLLLLDMRSFGKSDGTTTFGVLEVLDIKSAIDELEKRNYGRIGVFGFSMGGAAGLMAAAQDSRIAAVASYGSYSSLKQLGRELYGFVPGLNYILTELIALWGHFLLGIDATRQSPIVAAEQIIVPVMLMHAKNDELISVMHVQKLADALSHNKEVVLHLYDGPHGYLPTEFGDNVRDFFTKHIITKQRP